jgi:hypothetical protein
MAMLEAITLLQCRVLQVRPAQTEFAGQNRFLPNEFFGLNLNNGTLSFSPGLWEGSVKPENRVQPVKIPAIAG